MGGGEQVDITVLPIKTPWHMPGLLAFRRSHRQVGRHHLSLPTTLYSLPTNLTFAARPPAISAATSNSSKRAACLVVLSGFASRVLLFFSHGPLSLLSIPVSATLFQSTHHGYPLTSS